MVRPPQRPGDAKHVRLLPRRQRLAVADRLAPQTLGAIPPLGPKRVQGGPVHVGARAVEKPGPSCVAAAIEDAFEGGRQQVAQRAALDHQVHATKKTRELLARGIVHEVFVKDPIEKSESRSVLESDPGDVGTPDLESRRCLAPDGKESGVRFPVASGIDRPPTPLGVPGVDLRHGDVVTQQRPDGSVAAGEVQHSQHVARVAGFAHRAMDGLQRARQHLRHAVVGGPQCGEVAARVLEIVDPVEIVLVPWEAIRRIGHPEPASRDGGASAPRARRCRSAPGRP